jgi:predicted lipoprotein with Yx(FWY)xxD motif
MGASSDARAVVACLPSCYRTADQAAVAIGQGNTAVMDEKRDIKQFGRRLRRTRWYLAAPAAATLLAAACTGGGGYGATYGSSQTASSAPASSAAVGLRASSLGQTLVDGQGNTLYLFAADTTGKSVCTDSCASIWPPYLGTGTPKAGTGVTATMLSTISRSDGGMQVTYAGHPLYRYAGDSKPGDVAGQGLDQYGAKWFVVGANGRSIGAQ